MSDFSEMTPHQEMMFWRALTWRGGEITSFGAFLVAEGDLAECNVVAKAMERRGERQQHSLELMLESLETPDA